MGENYTGPAKNVKTLDDVLKATSSSQARRWKMRELDYLYDVASGMLGGASGGDLTQLQNSVREIVARKSDLLGRKWQWIAAISVISAVITAGLKVADSVKIQSFEKRVEFLETQSHSHPSTAGSLPNRPTVPALPGATNP